MPDVEDSPPMDSPLDEQHWVEEKVPYEAIVKRLHHHSLTADISTFYPPHVVAMLQEMATQAGAPVMFVVALFGSAVCLAAGPNVRVSAVHEGQTGIPGGWVELFNLTTFLASRSGGGKSNVLRLFKIALKMFERISGSSFMTTNFTIEALLERIGVHGSACVCLDEGKRLRETMGQYKQGKGDDALQLMEMQNGEDIVIDRKVIDAHVHICTCTHTRTCTCTCTCICTCRYTGTWHMHMHTRGELSTSYGPPIIYLLTYLLT